MNGIIIVDKPKDFTSFDVIAKLRGILAQRRLGHGGTLDPMATGVLPVFIGHATKAVDLMPDTGKRYTATVQLGVQTDTGDVTGEIIKTGVFCSEQDFSAVIPRFLGRQQQIPPMYSAVKVDGKRLYELARRGQEIERKPRDVEVFSINLLRFDEKAGQAVLDVQCSKGTYIRTLAEDMAAAAKSCGTLVALRRTASAGFTEQAARSLEEIEQLRDQGRLGEILRPVDSVFSDYDAVILDDRLARLFLNGVAFSADRTGQRIQSDVPVRVYREKDFLGLGLCHNGEFKKTKQFYFEDNNGK